MITTRFHMRGASKCRTSSSILSFMVNQIKANRTSKSCDILFTNRPWLIRRIHYPCHRKKRFRTTAKAKQFAGKIHQRAKVSFGFWPHGPFFIPGYPS